LATFVVIYLSIVLLFMVPPYVKETLTYFITDCDRSIVCDNQARKSLLGGYTNFLRIIAFGKQK